MTEEKKGLSCREAGRLGGQKTRDKYGPEFFEKIGKKGGKRMRELIERGKELERKG